jgi:hypothetical protein
MASRKELYEDSVRRLSQFVRSVSGEEFVRRLLNGTAEATAISADATPIEGDFAGILKSITDLLDGGKFADEILTEIDTFLSGKSVDDSNVLSNPEAKRLREFVRFTVPAARINLTSLSRAAGIVSGARSFGVNGNNDLKPRVYNKNAPGGNYILPEGYSRLNNGVIETRSKESPHISVIEILEPRAGTKVRDTTGLSIFASLIPTHIISRAVPYVAVKVFTNDIVQPRGGNQVVNSFNMIRYLKGYAPLTSETPATLAMVLGGAKGADGSQLPHPGGMELFTMPQSLVSDHEALGDSRAFPVRPADRFRPLLTLNSLTLDIVSAGAGMMSYKNASMNITLHDRGRLAEVASLVKPGAYSGTEVEIEYGWSIDPGSKNAKVTGDKITGFALQDDVFAQFVDSLRCREKFGVQNSSFQFDDAGQVTISLSLFTKGASEARSYDISAEGNKDTAQKLKAALDSVNKLISAHPTVENMLPESVLNAASASDGAVSLDDTKLAELDKAVKNLQNGKTSKVTKDIAKLLSEVISSSSEVRQAGESAAGDIVDKLVNEAEIFPPNAAIASSGNSVTPWRWRESGSIDFSEGSISLGRLLLRAVALPLSKSKKFDEIQLIFGKINSRASWVRDLSMAAFPLDKKKLQNEIKELYKKNIQVSSSMLISLIGGNHVGNSSYPAYGFTGQYDEDGELKANAGSEIDTILAAAGITDARFVMPKLQVNFECVPHYKNESQTILRIIVTDESASPFSEYSELVNAMRTDGSYLFGRDGLDNKQPGFPEANTAWADLQPGKITAQRNKLIDSLMKKIVVTPAGRTTDLTKLFAPTSPAAVKKFISEGLPIVRYGSSAGMVKNISVTSISDPALATINIIKSDEAEKDGPAATRKKGLPMIVTPTEVSMDLLGCPIINFGQSVYIDFGTGTTVDNIYACTGVTHTFNPGEFSTSAKFIINVGAYGIYNSERRAVDNTVKVATAAAGPAEPAPPTAAPGGQNRKTEFWPAGLTLAILEEARAAVQNASSIRIWTNPPNGLINTFEIYEQSLGHIEIVTSDSRDNSVLDSFPDSSFIETAYLIRKPEAQKIEGIKLSVVRSEIRYESYDIDLSTLKNA